MERISTRTKILLACFAVLVYAAGLFVTVMEIDAAQYAAMSRQIAASGNFWTSLLKPAGYLDKPPLIFFVSAVFFKLFGVSTAVYKLPSLLVMLLGFFSTYRLAKLFYGGRVGVLSAVILCSCEGIIFFTNDVRTDALLTGAVVFSVWQIAEFLQTRKKRFFIGGFAGIAFAMLAKGPIGVMVPFLAIGSYLAWKRDFGMFFKWYWLLGALIVLTLLSPMLWGLYSEYGWDGIEFYFWTQSFGRITGQSVWRDSSGYFYFVHTFLWAFLPWMLIAYYAVGEHAVKAVKNRFDPASAADLLFLGGTVFPFVALSFSHYKLPHYIFVIFPFAAVLTARTVLRLAEERGAEKAGAVFFQVQRVVGILIVVFAAVCLTAFFPCKNPVVWASLAFTSAAMFYFFSKKHPPLVRLVLPSLWAILGFGVMMNLHFFPELLRYQGGSNAASYVRTHHVPPDHFYAYRFSNYSVEFYAPGAVPVLDSLEARRVLGSREAWIYVQKDGLRSLEDMGFVPVSVDSFPNVHVSKITGKFLFFKTRPASTGVQYLLHFVPRTDAPPMGTEPRGGVQQP